MYLGVVNGMGNNDNWVFGPDEDRDNVYQNSPQVSLHGMDEGLTSKLNYGCLHAVILELMETKTKTNWTKAGVCRLIDRQVRVSIAL